MKLLIILLIILIILTTISNVCIYYIIDKPNGEKGIQGNKGIDGDIGYRGIIGDRGEQGSKGNEGNIGSVQGLPGIKGPIGDPGIRGIQGDKGFEGLRGITGLKGPQGFQGLKGPPGKTGIIGDQGPPRIISNYDDIKLMAYKNKCITIKSYGNNDPEKLTCPNNMAIFNMEGNKPDQNNDNINIDNITCCRFGLESEILKKKYNLLEIKTSDFIAIIGILLGEYNPTFKPNMTEDEKKIGEKLNYINYLLTQDTKIPKDLLYPLRLLYELKDDNNKFLEEVKKFPKNNIIELENYLKIE